MALQPKGAYAKLLLSDVKSWGRESLPIEDPKTGLAYFPTPKNACTSIKILMRHLIEGVDTDASNFEVIHDWVGTPGFSLASERTFKFCVIRDPVERFIAGYKNRVLHHDELGPEVVDHSLLNALGLVSRPTIEQFAESLEKYQVLSPSMLHHFRPQSYYIGPDLTYYDHVFEWKKLSEVSTVFSDYVGMPVYLKRTQSGGGHVDEIEVPFWVKKHVAYYYMGDYALFAGYYDAGTYLV